MQKVFIVEDDKQIREELCTLLERNLYNAEACTDFRSVVGDVLAAAPDVVLLDLNLPYVDGHVVCRELRQRSNVPIIVVTSRDSDLDELMAMNLGADDFVTKPYRPQILLARIANVLRRSSGSSGSSGGSGLSGCDRADDGDRADGDAGLGDAGLGDAGLGGDSAGGSDIGSNNALSNASAKATAPSPQAILNYRGLELNIAKAQIAFGDEQRELTKNELRILQVLMQNAEKIVRRVDLQNELWQSDQFVDDNTLTVNVNRLRATLAGIGAQNMLHTKRGLGYYLSAEVD